MINLNDKSIQDYRNHYSDELRMKIVDGVNNLPRTSINCFNNEPVSNLFQHNGFTLDQTISDLLTEKIEYLCKKYSQFGIYFRTAEFVFLTLNKIKKDLKDVEDKSLRKELRKQHVESYFDSPWIQNLAISNPGYEVSDKKMSHFVKDIVGGKLKTLNGLISSVLRYEILTSDQRDTVLEKLEIEVCPYCNRNFISKFKRNGKLKSTADLDHFYPKTYFLLFSLSLYNFVPSCQVCNSRFKSYKGAKILNPYTDKVDYKKLKFTYEMIPNSKLNMFIGESMDFQIKLECLDESYKDHIDMFELENLYDTHKISICEILYKKTAYNDTYVDSINTMLNEMNLTKEERDLFMYGIDMKEESFYKRPLSKLIFDLVNQD